MESPLLLIAAVLALGLFYVLLPLSIHTFQRFRHRKVITCSETKRLAEVTLEARRAAFASAFHKPQLRVKSCTLWPKRKGCAEKCVPENWDTR